MRKIISLLVTLTFVKSQNDLIPTSTTTEYEYEYELEPEEWTQTKILTKKGIDLANHADKSIQIASPEDGDFQTFIRQSSFWVDKSLLVPSVLLVWKEKFGARRSPLTVNYVAAPSKWGKSINLSMMKFYFELSVNESGFEIPRDKSESWLYFNEGKVVMEDGSIQELDGIPLISTSDLKDPRDLANYPIVYIRGTNLTSELDSFRRMVHETYHRHENLLKRLYHEQQKAKPDSSEYKIISQQIQDFVAFFDWEKLKTRNEWELQRSMKILSKILSWTYKRPVVILFDDYDHYIQDKYFNTNHSNLTLDTILRDYTMFYEIFMSITVNYNEYMTTAILTGVIRTGFPLLMHVKCGSDYFPYVGPVDLFPFYGIFQPEFLEMARKRGIDESLMENATHWYGGYRSRSHLNIMMYSTYSVTRFINTLQLREYRPTNSPLLVFIKNLLQQPLVQPDALAFLNTFNGHKVFHSLLYDNYEKLLAENFRRIRMMQMGIVPYYPEPFFAWALNGNRDFVFSILLHEGYAALHEDQIISRNPSCIKVNITLPNQEVYNQISALLGNDP